MPLTTLALFAFGVLQRSTLRCRVYLLWLLALAVQYAAWLRSGTPIFGGTKHWMTAYPFIALFAGVGAQRALGALGTRWRWGPAVLTVALSIPSVVQSARVHPWGLSAYTPLVGGASGAASTGLNRGFWGYTTGSVAEYLNAHAPKPRADLPARHRVAGVAHAAG